MAKKKAPKKAKLAKPVPRQKRLPGMTDSRVAILENAAHHYADVRDERMEWTKKEVEAKKRVQDLMHDQKREHYAHGNIEIILAPEGEKVIVRIKGREQTPEVEDQPVAPPVREPEPEAPPTGDEPVEQPADELEEEFDEEEEGQPL